MSTSETIRPTGDAPPRNALPCAFFLEFQPFFIYLFGLIYRAVGAVQRRFTTVGHFV